MPPPEAHELAGRPPGRSAPDAGWTALAQARNAQELCQAWLLVLCGMFAQVRSGVLLLREHEGSYVPAAAWPPDRDLSHLGEIAQSALVKREGVVQREADGLVRCAYPLGGAEPGLGAVVLELVADEAELARAMRMVHWGAGWLVDLFDRRALSEQAQRLDRSAFLIDLALAAMSETDFHKAGLTVVNRLAQQFGCHQVLLGLEKGQTVRVEVMSHSAWFEQRSNRVHLAALAMNEAFDQRATVRMPEPVEGATRITAALRAYQAESGSAALCAMPLESGNRIVAVWLLERDEPFIERDLESLEAIGLALAPVLQLKLAAQESLWAHGRRSWQALARSVTDTSRPGVKLVVAAAVLLLVLLAIVPADYRVTSQAVIEGSVQRVAVAPFQGYLREAPVRAGDQVRRGQVLAVLEDKDLRLERVRWEAELEVAVRKEREAMANADRVALRQASAQANQARAQLDLTLEKLARVQVSAPFDGIVVKGDLSQELGSPVEQGKVLFELAPVDSWRVILKVDERDIAQVREQQPGELVLASLPGQAYALQVHRVTPVSVTEDGRNYFRVEARLSEEALRQAGKMRPGMEGVAKVAAGRRSLLWIWTHRLLDWARLKAWEWTL